MRLNDFFEKVFCINLKRRNDRFHEMMSEFAKHQIDAEFFSAVDGSLMAVPEIMSEDGTVIAKGYWGCLLSHLHVIKEARQRGYKNYMVFEDDADLHPDFQKQFSDYVSRLPEDWEMIYFGGNHMEKPKMVGDNVARISKTFTTHAFGVKESAYDFIIEAWDKIEKLDITLAKLQKHLNCYVFQPHLVMQRASHSDILNRHNEDWTLEKRPT